MSLPLRHRRILAHIESGLSASEPTLASLFVIFERLTEDEAMPWAESVQTRPVADRLARVSASARRVARRPAARIRALLVVPAALVAMACAITAAVSHGGQRAAGGGKQSVREQVVSTRACRVTLLRAPSRPCPPANR